MANQLTMAEIDAILTLHTTGHSNREIAVLLGIDRETVGKYVARAKSQNQPNAPTGPANSPLCGPPSECEPFRAQILAKVAQDLEAVRIWQDLLEEHGPSRLVRVFNDRFEQVAAHAKAEPGRFRTAAAHIPQEKVSAVERGTDAMLRQIAAIGPHTRQWAEATTQARGVEAVRVLVGLRHLAGKHDSEALEEACRVALSHGAYRLRTVRKLLQRKGREQRQFEFLEEHPIIRPLSDYSLDSLLQFRKDRQHDECQTG